MAMITNQNAIRYCIDNLNTSSYGVIITKSGSEIDCTKATSITGFNINYSQPAGTSIKILFCDSDSPNWFKLNSSGNAIKIMTGTPEYEDININGNTISELTALNLIPAFTGKKILMAIALSTPDKANAVPRIKLEVKAQNATQTLTHSEYSPLYEFSNTGTIANINIQKETTGDSEINVYAQVTRSDGSLSEWLPYADINGQKCKNIKLRADYSVRSLNSGSAILNRTSITYSDGAVLVSGAGVGEIISLTQDWYMNVKHCRMNIKHTQLIDSEINTYVCFRTKPKVIQSEHLGIGTGKRATYQLNHPDGLKYDTVRLYYDSQRVYSEYEVNSEVGRVTCTAPEGAIISCDYVSGWEAETWHKMYLHSQYSLEDYDVSEFRFTRPDEENDKSVCAVKIELVTKSGIMTHESIGTGTGKNQTYKLAHTVSDGKISIYSNGTAITANAYSLSEDSQYVKIAASSGAKLTASYNWVSETPCVYQFAAVFSE